MQKDMFGADRMKRLGDTIKKEIPGFGFTLLVFEFHNPGIANYISNANRQDMIVGLRRMVDILEKGKDFPTPHAG